ncbi:MAG TPA: Na+/H+ antiporter [Nocardioidaceae bacterium]|nr:Na+/H+ antiporter [Nocardioidaceae bacterium]
MHLALTLVVLVSVVTAVGALARRFELPAPLILTLVGAVASFVPFIPRVELTAELALFGLLPPLLYAAAIRTSLIDFRHNARPIGLLSVGLVLFTTIGVGLVVWLMLGVGMAPGQEPVSLPAALALGAVVAPPDAVAATAIARRVGLPRRMVTILEGESLVNDATALVCLRAAVGATLGTVTVWSVAGEFVLSVGGGLVVGVLVAVVVGKLRKKISDPLTDTSVSLVTPFVSYLLAEEIHASGVLALVVTGLLLGHMSPRLQSATSRIFERTNWATIQFVLENTVFLLIGLQVEQIMAELSANTLPRTQVAAAALAVLATVVVLRFAWVFPVVYLPGVLSQGSGGRHGPGWQVPLVISWAGMRGVVTLAAVFVLPPGLPHREVLVLIALVVVAGTLLLQGSTLPYLVRRVGLSGPDMREEALAEAATYQRAATAGLSRLEEIVSPHDPEDVVEQLRTRSLDRANAVWERLGSEDETPSQAYSRLRAQMLQAERDEVLRIRRRGGVPHEVLERVLASLDIEETVLERVNNQDLEERGEELHAPHTRAWCQHLRAAGRAPSPRTPEGCEECLAEGLQWVHLRLCLDCGHVGCCDSSVGRHASGHYAQSQHPVVRSFETGEAWRWCFVDEVLG